MYRSRFTVEIVIRSFCEQFSHGEWLHAQDHHGPHRACCGIVRRAREAWSCAGGVHVKTERCQRYNVVREAPWQPTARTKTKGWGGSRLTLRFLIPGTWHLVPGTDRIYAVFHRQRAQSRPANITLLGLHSKREDWP